APGSPVFRSRTRRSRQHRPAPRGDARQGLPRRGCAPPLRHPQHDHAAERRHLPRDRGVPRSPRLGQGPLRPGGARALRSRRRVARLGRRGRRHRRVRDSSGPRGRQGQPAPADRRGAALAADRGQQPAQRPTAPLLHQVGVTGGHAPQHRCRPRVLPRHPRDRRRPPARQRVAGRVGRGAAGGRQGRVGRPQRHPRDPGGAVPDQVRPGPAL
ncbi:MAG: FIG00981735: hypothetical protein, partial [uncultured Nocardioides sp.]